MRRVTQVAMFVMTLLMVGPLLAQEEGKREGYKGGPEEGTGGAILSGLFSDWLIWTLLIGLVVLIGVFLYIRNKRDDDD